MGRLLGSPGISHPDWLGKLRVFRDQAVTDSCSGSGPACHEMLVFPAVDSYRTTAVPDKADREYRID